MYTFSRLARLDLFEIADHTVDTWGLEQANHSLDSITEGFGKLAQNPEIGRPCEQVRSGYLRFEMKRHVIFYRLDRESIFISLILHQRRLPSLQALEDD